jgi:ZIP family zinc transporter
MRWFEDLSPVVQALLGGLGTWGVTALGAAGVVLLRKVNQRLLDVMLGFAAGVMLAASFWSLLAPAIELAGAQGVPSWVPAAVGLVLGGVFLRVVDAVLPHLHPGYPRDAAEGVATRWHRTTLMVTAITLHNIPEGLAVGVAFGAVGAGLELNGAITLSGALALTVGIAIQNFPEGVAVAMPIRGMGVSRFRSFWYGQLSAVVEPIAAVIGAAAVVAFRPLLPYALAFAAGAMIYVVIEELIPESQRNGNEDIATVATIVGFMVMMILDVALG